MPSGKKRPHFAHEGGSNCANGTETALHLAAKQLIEERAHLFVPALEAVAKGQVGRFEERVCKASVVLPGVSALEAVRIEVAVGSVKPDLVVSWGGKEVFVEIAVTHFVDEAKLLKLATLGRPTIEINLADLREFTFDELANRLFSPSESSTWVYHPDEAVAKVKAESELRALLAADALIWDQEEQALLKAQAAAEAARQQARQREEASAKRLAAWRARQDAERQNRAAAFRALPNSTKLTKVARYLHIDETDLPEFVGVRVRGAQVIQAPPRVWQLTVFAELFRDAAAGNLYITSEKVQDFLRPRFVIEESGAGLAVAVWDFLSALTERNLLHRLRKQSFVVTVSGVNAAINVARDARSGQRAPLAWNEEWPDGRATKKLAKAYAEHLMNPAMWERVAGLLPQVRSQGTPEKAIDYYRVQCRGNAEDLRRFFLSVDFARLG